jgi:glutaredoxin 3
MPHITIYTTPICPYCVRAKDLLKKKGIEQWEEIDVSKDPEVREAMITRAGGRRSFPLPLAGEGKTNAQLFAPSH